MSVELSPDTERVLGQIARGEMRCGRDAAREIAARHQEAYGNKVWGQSAAPTPKKATALAIRPTSRRNVNHTEVAAALKAAPGQWQFVGEWPSRAGAESAALRIRGAYKARMYEPAGSFDARTELTEMGCLVEARYLGDATSDDEVWADALAALPQGGAE